MYNYELKSIGNEEMKEFILESDGYKLIGFLGRGNHFNWLALPQLCVSMKLARFNDDFWNREQLALSIDNPVLDDLLIEVIHDLHSCFEK